MPQRSGTPSTRSTPLSCSRKIRSIVSGRSRRIPPTSPPRATTDMILATERAFPCPFAAPMSAPPARGVGVLGLRGRAREGLERRAVLAGRLQVDRQRRRRDHVRDPLPVAFLGADLEIGAERPGDFIGHELLERLAADPPHDLADQVTVTERVVTRRGSRLPPRSLGGHPGGGLRPVVEILDDGGLVQPGYAAAKRHPRVLQPNGPVTVVRVWPAVMAEALRLADGDSARVRVLWATSCLVTNQPGRAPGGRWWPLAAWRWLARYASLDSRTGPYKGPAT